MFRGILCSLYTKASSGLVLKSYSPKVGTHSFIPNPWINQRKDNFSSLVSPLLDTSTSQRITNYAKCTLLDPPQCALQQVRTVIKYSMTKGRRKSVAAVPARFFRLNWGIWIRTKAGRHKKLWKKSAPQKRRLSQHVFCNATQCTMLDKMVNKFWKKPRYYIEDPYEPYQNRENFNITKRKPWRPEGVDYE